MVTPGLEGVADAPRPFGTSEPDEVRSDDPVVPVQVAWNMVRLLPDADLAVFARCGHWTQIERADDFNTLVGNFLAAAGQARN